MVNLNPIFIGLMGNIFNNDIGTIHNIKIS